MRITSRGENSHRVVPFAGASLPYSREVCDGGQNSSSREEFRAN